MSAYLSWAEARSEAEAGKLVRREAWPLPGSDRAWLRRRAVLWESLDKRLASLGIVEAAEFTSAEFFATDWTTDDVGAVRDSCQRPAPRLLYAPPGIRLTGELAATLRLTLDVGDSAPSGAYWATFVANGFDLGTVEVPTPGRYTLEADAIAGEIYAQVRVVSASPLPKWEGLAFWRFAPVEDEIDLHALFPQQTYPPIDPADPVRYRGAHTFGPFPDKRWIYSLDPSEFPGSIAVALSTALVINGTTATNDIPDLSGSIFPSTLVHVLPAGETFTVDCRIPWYGGVTGSSTSSPSGPLRMFNYPLF